MSNTVSEMAFHALAREKLNRYLRGEKEKNGYTDVQSQAKYWNGPEDGPYNVYTDKWLDGTNRHGEEDKLIPIFDEVKKVVEDYYADIYINHQAGEHWHDAQRLEKQIQSFYPRVKGPDRLNFIYSVNVYEKEVRKKIRNIISETQPDYRPGLPYDPTHLREVLTKERQEKGFSFSV